MGPKPKDKRKETKRQRWKPLDAETKQSREEEEPTVDTDSTPNLLEGKTSSVSTPTPIEPTCDPQFRKRKISSNWSRYDEPVDVETEYNRKRGEDFDLLLSLSAGASAHFRFKEQQDWQDEPAEISEFLSIDCDTIVQALHTIPLHKRLDLPGDIFPAKVIEEFNAEAAIEKERYEAFLRMGKRQVKKVPDVGESLKNSLQAAIAAAASKPKPKPKDDDLDELLESCLSLKPKSKPAEADNSEKKTEDDKNLEFLLSLTQERGDKVPASRDTAPVEAKGGAAEETVKPPSQPQKPAAEPEKPAPEPQKPTVDLEDWLDSVLQD
uniref:Putative cell death regulator aven n=1 Tax=Amblyomma aureolatum TaxID=187763 RepID=A0A1E1XB64_9ACAR